MIYVDPLELCSAFTAIDTVVGAIHNGYPDWDNWLYLDVFQCMGIGNPT